MSRTDEERDSAILDEAIQLLEKTTEYQMLVEKLKPLVQPMIPSSEGSKDFRDFLRQSLTRFKKSGERMRHLKEDSKAEYGSQLDTLRKAFLYLAFFETSVTNILDLVVMLLVFNGHDFFVQYPRKYARNLDDLEGVSVREKLDFLNFHGFSIFAENINSNLRNKIAHMDFDIESKGIIYANKQKYDLQNEIIKLEAFVLLSGKALGSLRLFELLSEKT